MSENLYQVEKILRKKIDQDGTTKYLIQWKGWSRADATWEPLENLSNVFWMIDNFEAKLKKPEQPGNQMKPVLPLHPPSQEKARLTKPNPMKKPSKEVNIKDEEIKEWLSSENELSLHGDESDYEEISNCGKIECDIPNKIISAQIKTDKEVSCYIEWRKRYNGETPDNSWVSSKEMRKLYPDLLIDYYESKLQVRNKK